MTDTPAPNLAQLDPIERVEIVHAELIGRIVQIMRAENPEAPVEGIAAELVLWMASALMQGFGVEVKAALRGGVLRAFEALHDKPVSFIDAGHAKAALLEMGKQRKASETGARLILN